MKLLRHFRSRDLILLYHRIARIDSDPWSLCVTPEHFSEHLEVLRKHRPIRLDQVKPSGWQGIGGRSSVAITFDDGYADNLYEAKRLLERYDIPATFFIATGYIGAAREFWWDELEKIILQSDRLPEMLQCSITGKLHSWYTGGDRLPLYQSVYEKLQPLPHETRREALDQLLDLGDQPSTRRESHRSLIQEEVCELARGGLVEIGAHTATHPVLAAQPLKAQCEELRQSKTWLEDLLGRPVTSFSYPYGGSQHYSSETVQAVRELGFARACTTSAHPVGKSDGQHELPRFNVTDMDGDQFEKFLFS
jgi:peptidoglycan/xylan/chitin deacetylase (PgdA/CDA1 family)